LLTVKYLSTYNCRHCNKLTSTRWFDTCSRQNSNVLFLLKTSSIRVDSEDIVMVNHMQLFRCDI